MGCLAALLMRPGRYVAKRSGNTGSMTSQCEVAQPGRRRVENNRRVARDAVADDDERPARSRRRPNRCPSRAARRPRASMAPFAMWGRRSRRCGRRGKETRPATRTSMAVIVARNVSVASRRRAGSDRCHGQRRRGPEARLDPEPRADADADHGRARPPPARPPNASPAARRTPATIPFAVLPITACSDDAMPRRSGTRSSTIKVTTGTIIAQPKAINRDRQQRPPRAAAANMRFTTTLSSDDGQP